MTTITLEALESEITQADKSYIRKGSALKKIRDKKLYQPVYRSFAAYLDLRWDTKLDKALRAINAADVAEGLISADLPAPSNQSVALTLGRIPDFKTRVETWETLVLTHGEPKGRHVAELLDSSANPAASPRRHRMFKIPVGLYSRAEAKAKSRKMNLDAYVSDLIAKDLAKK